MSSSRHSSPPYGLNSLSNVPQVTAELELRTRRVSSLRVLSFGSSASARKTNDNSNRSFGALNWSLHSRKHTDRHTTVTTCRLSNDSRCSSRHAGPAPERGLPPRPEATRRNGNSKASDTSKDREDMLSFYYVPRDQQRARKERHRVKMCLDHSIPTQVSKGLAGAP